MCINEWWRCWGGAFYVPIFSLLINLLIKFLKMDVYQFFVICLAYFHRYPCNFISKQHWLTLTSVSGGIQITAEHSYIFWWSKIHKETKNRERKVEGLTGISNFETFGGICPCLLDTFKGVKNGSANMDRQAMGDWIWLLQESSCYQTWAE